MKWFSRNDLRTLSAVVCWCVLLGSVPLNSGVVIASGSTRPMITLDLCQPLQPTLTVSGVPIARPAAGPPHQILRECGPVLVSRPKPPNEFNSKPESPPPKAPA